MFDPMLQRISAGALGLLAIGVFAAMELGQEAGGEAVQNPIRTDSLELTNAEGDVVARLSVVQDEGMVTAYQGDGTRAWQGRFVDGKREGPWIVWSGRWIQMGQFENDRKVGVWKKYSTTDVQLIEEGSYQDDLREGLWRTWSDTRRFETWEGPVERRLASSGPYVKGQRHGIWTFWYMNGQKYAEGEFREGKRAGNWSVWNEEGGVVESESGFYDNGIKMR